MKTHLVIAFVLFSTIALSSNELSWVDTQVEAIKPPRKGMSNSEIANAKTPFIFLKKNKTKSDKKAGNKSAKAKKKTTTSPGSSNVVSKKSSKSLVLSAVINKSALINGKWYMLNDSVYSYKLSNVNRTSVVLRKGKKKLVLTTTDMKQNLKFK